MTQKCKAADESFIGGDEKKGKTSDHILFENH